MEKQSFHSLYSDRGHGPKLLLLLIYRQGLGRIILTCLFHKIVYQVLYLGIYHYFMAGHYYYVSIIFHGDLVILTVAQKRLVFDKQIADFYISTQLTNTILKLKLNFIF